MAATAATLASDDADDDEHDSGCWASSTEVLACSSGERDRSRAWSGCKSADEGRRWPARGELVEGRRCPATGDPLEAAAAVEGAAVEQLGGGGGLIGQGLTWNKHSNLPVEIVDFFHGTSDIHSCGEVISFNSSHLRDLMF